MSFFEILDLGVRGLNSHLKIADLGFAKAVLKESERSCLSGTDGFGFEEKEMQAFFGKSLGSSGTN